MGESWSGVHTRLVDKPTNRMATITSSTVTHTSFAIVKRLLNCDDWKASKENEETTTLFSL